jgi:hypothetical protein
MSLSKQHLFRSLMAVLAVVMAAVVVLAAVLAAGCSKPGLVGTWYSAAEDVTIEFTSDGKVISDEFQGAIPDYKAENGKITITVAGLEAALLDYTLDGDTLVLTDRDTGEPATFTRQKSGATGGTATTSAAATETTVAEEVTSGVLSVDPALVGTWYSAEVGETLAFTADGLALSSYDSDEGVMELVYSANGSEIVFNDGSQDIIVQYSVDSDVLTINDPETGDSAFYLRVAN